MKVKIPVLVKDPDVTRWKGVPLTQWFEPEADETWLDGPISRRVAILDFDPDTGALAAPARFVAPDGRRTLGRYAPVDEHAPGDPGQLADPRVRAVLTFAGVHKTLEMFEEDDCLGRKVDWAFDGEQLLVVPRAGEWANAFYERQSRSLQFFFFTPAHGGDRIYTSDSMDIIAHETAHAVIDGVVPDLYDAVSPQALAIHESMADIATVIMAFRSRQLADRVLEQTGGSIEQSTAFTAVAEQFGEAVARNVHALRELHNDKELADVDPTSPHALSEVLSGALYAVMVRIYEARRKLEDPPRDGRALGIAADQFKRMVFRALDYLPPGDVSFADFGRALLASDQASHPDSGEPREWLVHEFVRRGMAGSADELVVRTNHRVAAVKKLPVQDLVDSDWLAYDFVTKNAKLLSIPPRTPFEIRPRLTVTKTYYHRGEVEERLRECLLKVSWTEEEDSDIPHLPRRRRVIRGSTLAIDCRSGDVRAIVTTRPTAGGHAEREAFLRRLAADGDLEIVHDGHDGPDGRRDAVRAEISAGTYRLRSTAHALHLCLDPEGVR